MQELIIDRVVKKEASKPGGTPFYIVYGQDGEEMTSFDTAIAALGKGSRINVEPKIKGKHVNIAKWEIVEAKDGNPGPTGNGGGSYKRDTEGIRFEYELKARLQARERHSIESQTAFNGAIEILTSPVMKTYTELPKPIKELVEKALKWGSDTLTRSGEPTAPAVPEKKKETMPGSDDKAEVKHDKGHPSLHDFKTGTDLVNYAMKSGWKLREIREVLNIKQPSDITDIEKAAKVLFPDEGDLPFD